MELKNLLLLCTAAYALHAMEEFIFDWRGWARAVLMLPVEWSSFYVTNFAVIVLGFVSAGLAQASPVVGLAFPALMMINAIFFHILPFLRTRGRFSPGLMTAVALFIPLGFWCYRTAYLSAATSVEIVMSFVIGAALMAFPVVCLKAGLRPYFQQRA
jgi:hypothetical protein